MGCDPRRPLYLARRASIMTFVASKVVRIWRRGPAQGFTTREAMIAPAQTENLASLAHLDLEEEILRLKRGMNAVILAHYYQDSEIQDLADFVGDSLQLSQQAATTSADAIIFAGVLFMAETAKILSPNKLVLLPDMKAGCS